MTDLNDTSGCPVAEHCACCGSGNVLQAVTFVTGIGVHCDTVCAVCLWLTANTAPSISVGEAMRRVAAHCDHLSIDLDQMAAALRGEEDV